MSMIVKNLKTEPLDESRISALVGYVTKCVDGKLEPSRSDFYLLAREMTPAEIDEARERCHGYVHSLFADEIEESPLLSSDTRRKLRLASRIVDRCFRPWFRLAGRMECDMKVDMVDLADKGGRYTETDFAACLDYHAALPEYAPYVGKQMFGFAYNRCHDGDIVPDLDYLKLPDRWRLPELEASWRKEHGKGMRI